MLDIIAEQVVKSDMEKDRPNNLIFAEDIIVEELKQGGNAGGGFPKQKTHIWQH